MAFGYTDGLQLRLYKFPVVRQMAVGLCTNTTALEQTRTDCEDVWAYSYEEAVRIHRMNEEMRKGKYDGASCHRTFVDEMATTTGVLTEYNVREAIERIRRNNWSFGNLSQTAPPVKKHVCYRDNCKPNQTEFYEGLLDYHRQLRPEKVKELEAKCDKKNPMCVLEQLNRLA